MKPVSPYELREEISNTLLRLVSVYEDEIYDLKCELEKAKEEIEALIKSI